MPAQASQQVTTALSREWWSPACDGLAAVTSWRVKRRPNESESHFLDVLAGERKIQVYVSPTGRSVRVFVDGKEA
jgi:hypothetical protein